MLVLINVIMGRRQVVRHRILIPAFGGSNPPVPAKYLSLIQKNLEFVNIIIL